MAEAVRKVLAVVQCRASSSIDLGSYYTFVCRTYCSILCRVDIMPYI
jgi:hypothetical protein